MRILYFIGTLASGGKERRLIELLRKMNSVDKENILIVLRHEVIEYPVFHELGIKYVLLTPSYRKMDFRLPFHFYKICKSFKPDIVHTWSSISALISIFAVSTLRIKHVNSQIADALSINFFSLRNIKNRINFIFSDVVLSNSQAGIDAYNPPRKKSKVIHNGFDFERISKLESKEKIRLKYNIKSEFVIGMFASFSITKDWHSFFEIANVILSKRDDITFICAGGGDDSKYRDLVTDINKESVLFLGRQVNVENVMNICDVGLLLSHGEGISNSIMELMALGIPVCASSYGGTKELIVDKKTGFLVDDNEVNYFCLRILQLLDSEQLRTQLGFASKKRIKEYFEIHKMVNQFEEIYVNI